MNFDVLKLQYEQMFQNCKINEACANAVNQIVDRILADENRYRLVQNKTGVPWSIVAAIHSLEASLNFNSHLHNGDPLDHKTVHVPAGRPAGNPPFAWEASAADALTFDGLNTWQEWTIPGALFVLERFNGAGYNKRGLPSPYLWSFSNNYAKGKFVADGKFDAEAVSKQCGAGVLLRAMLDRDVDLGLIVNHAGNGRAIPNASSAEVGAGKMIYPGRIVKIGDADVAVVRPLQLRLVALGCGDLRGTGFFGKNTEAAVKMFQARFLDADGRPLVIDGEVGALTWAALFGADAVPKADKPPSDLLEKVLQIAAGEIGVKEDPPFCNRGEKVEEYLAAVGLSGGSAWCMAFVYWCFERAARELNMTNPAVKTGGVLNAWTEARRRLTPCVTAAQALDNPALVQPGMIFIIDTGDPGKFGHTGLVEAVNGGRLTTIEGNTNAGGSREGIGVFRRDARKISSINKGFINYGGV